MLEEADFVFAQLCIFPSGRDDPVIVAIFVVVACHLLLLRANWVGLDMRVQETSAVAHVLERKLRTESCLCIRGRSQRQDCLALLIPSFNAPRGFFAKSLPYK